jgi:asparagine synthase (glutamine-hydrolysing)
MSRSRNWQVYDHIEIGRSLKEEYPGITITDSTDTAVVLALYIIYGPTPEFFSRLNGEFAFVIWDPLRQKLVAARDRFGVKPLFWYRDSSRLIFASEIKAILSVNGIQRKFSRGMF